MRDLLESLDSIVNEKVPDGAKPFQGSYNNKTQSLRNIDGKTYVINKPPKPAPKPVAYNNPMDMIKAIITPGKQGDPDPNVSAANIAKARAPKPTKITPINAPSVDADDMVGDPKTKLPQVPNKLGPDGKYSGDDLGNAPTTPKPKAPRAKVKATAANTKDFDKTMALQQKLKKAGYDIAADGIMGPNTRAALKKYQASQVKPKSKGPDPLNLAGPSPEVKAKAAVNREKRLQRRAERQKASADFFRDLGKEIKSFAFPTTKDKE